MPKRGRDARLRVETEPRKQNHPLAAAYDTIVRLIRPRTHARQGRDKLGVLETVEHRAVITSKHVNPRQGQAGYSEIGDVQLVNETRSSADADYSGRDRDLYVETGACCRPRLCCESQRHQGVCSRRKED